RNPAREPSRVHKGRRRAQRQPLRHRRVRGAAGARGDRPRQDGGRPPGRQARPAPGPRDGRPHRPRRRPRSPPPLRRRDGAADRLSRIDSGSSIHARSLPEGNMTTGNVSLTSRAAWKGLEGHFSQVRGLHLRQLFADDPTRGERMTVEAAGIYFDYSKHRVTDETLELLLRLAEECGLRSRIDAMFRGEKINVTEKRAVLHVALRAPRGESIVVDGEDVVPHVHAVLDKMADFANRVRSGEWKGHTGRPIRNIVNVGIGGSDLGPVMAYEALRHYSRRDMTFRFVSNIDSTDFAEATRDLDAAETLFIISSKTFTTLETMTNALTARAWAL